VHERYRWQTTDRQTDDRQTDGRMTTTYSEHEHEITFAKNDKVARRGSGPGHVTYFSNFGTPNICGTAENTNFKFCMQTNRKGY